MLRKGKAKRKKKDLQTHCIAAMLLSWSISALVGTFSRLPLPLTGLLSLGGILCFGQLMTVTCKWQENVHDNFFFWYTILEPYPNTNPSFGFHVF